LDVPDDVADTEVLLDRMRFPLALANLIDNAFKFYRTPGDAEVILRARAETHHLLLEVHDNGIGIADSLGDRVFERFTQGDMSATRRFQGVGLGLAVVQVITAAHDGKVRLVPPVLGGASVRITLPRMETD
jgi:signal transduction histidine kinase